MPGHFTHIYAARRVADLLAGGTFTDWPKRTDTHTAAAAIYTPAECGKWMKRWEKFTAIGAVGPDLFYFSQDYNNPILGPQSDRLMLLFATYYYFDAAMEDDWEPLLIILEEVSSEMATILRLLIKLDKIWQTVVDAWNATIGPFVSAVGNLLDGLTGGLLSQLQTTLEELKVALLEIGKQELFTFADIFSWFDTCVQKGWPEASFLWSDMSHYRGTSAMCQALVNQAELLKTGEGGQERFEQFMAFSLGYMTHVGTDVIGHSFVNEQVGGAYRNHPARHHLIENHIDAWNYQCSKPGGTIPPDPWGYTDDYPDLSMSAMWFAVQLTPDKPEGEQRPFPLPEDPVARKEALDVDGEMPDWMAEAIVKAMIDAFPDSNHRPTIFQGSTFQNSIDEGVLTEAVKKITGHELDKPFDQILDGIAPKPSFDVPVGFPLPWEIATTYRIMISFYKFSYKGTWELQKPRKPDVIIWPPESDFTNFFQPPDFSGVDSSDPLEDICAIFIALFEWVVKEIENAIELVGDLIKMVVSPTTYPLRLALYKLAMSIWDIAVKTHDVLAHTGFVIPHGEQRYQDGELRLPNEIDIPMITLGGSVDASFRQALADAIDPLGNLDQTNSVIALDHPILDDRSPYYPVLRFQRGADGKFIRPPEGWEYHRPWAYPDQSVYTPDGVTNLLLPTLTETYDPNQPTASPRTLDGHVRAGPYPARTMPDQVFFRTTVRPDQDARTLYEGAKSPADTDWCNILFIKRREMRSSPLGDLVPFSAYLIGKLANHTDYTTQWNLDSDRGYGYLTWDWVRGQEKAKTDMNVEYIAPVVAPPGVSTWDLGQTPLQLEYVGLPVKKFAIRSKRRSVKKAVRRASSRKKTVKKRLGAP